MSRTDSDWQDGLSVLMLHTFACLLQEETEAALRHPQKDII
jgi:hypothetical protein